MPGSTLYPMYAVTVSLMTLMFTVTITFRNEPKLSDKVLNSVPTIKQNVQNPHQFLSKKNTAAETFAELNKLMKDKPKGSMEKDVIKNGLFSSPQPETPPPPSPPRPTSSGKPIAKEESKQTQQQVQKKITTFVKPITVQRIRN
eukprot:TRINITY_DN36986_c0_g1_i1.p1 TRINITY_DN36986_c0_g1~~TRINITY_DN36986_c0_g1_i1.p1  ORF type:complete len:164 (+),score=33.28 TRINITY_DN36986_c0_g1_i1:63-494(+)